METLQVIATQTLSSTYKKYVDRVLGFQATYFDYRTGTGQGKSDVYVRDKQGNVRKVLLNYFKNENGWFLDVKGLKEALLDTRLIVNDIPSSLQPAIILDTRNIGQTKLLANVSQLELDALSNKELIEKPSVEGKTVSRSDSKTEKEGQPAVSSLETEASQRLVIDVTTQEGEIENLLKPLMNREVELQTREGKFKDGIYVGIYRKQVVLETQVGGGTVESLTEYPELNKLRVLNASSIRPQLVEFQHSNNL
jgi:hypothetical protein